MKDLININGVITPLEDAKISATDRGFLFADNIFETLVAFDRKILNLKKHLERLRISAENMQIPIPWSDEELEFELKTMVEQNKHPKGFLRFVVTRGDGFGISYDEEKIHPNKYIYSLPAKQDPDWVQQNGIALKKKKSKSTRRGPAVKTGNYLSSIVAINKAKSEGYQDIFRIHRKTGGDHASS